jgi:hypothetical protein
MERHWGLDSSAHLFSPAYIYNQIKQSSDCQGGSLISDALNLLRTSGDAPLGSFPYDSQQCDAIPGDSIKQSARMYSIADWRRVNVQDETEIKTQLAAGFPVVIGMIVDRAFSSLKGDQIYSTPDGVQAGGHAMVVVGYDDQRSAFKVINSWGTGWGDHGFGWIAYKTFRSQVREGYVAQDIVLSPPTPIPVPKPTPPPKPVAAPHVTVGTPQILHNIPVKANVPFGTAPGMQIAISGDVTGGAGHILQVVAHFNYLNGPPLLANPQEQIYRDVTGLVATGIPATPIGTDSEDLSRLTMSIPYFALNFPSTNGMNSYNLSLSIAVLLDGVVATQTPATPFLLRY